MSAETRDLLRNRLRIAAILFFVGFLVFLIRWGFNWDEWFTAEHRPMFFIHAAITVVLGAFAVRIVPSLQLFVDEAARGRAGYLRLSGVLFLRAGAATSHVSGTTAGRASSDSICS